MFEFEQSGRRSTTSLVGGEGDELRYTTEADDAAIESPAMRDLQYASLMTHEQQLPKPQQSAPAWDEQQRRPVDNIDRERPVEYKQSREKPAELDVNIPTSQVYFTAVTLVVVVVVVVVVVHCKKLNLIFQGSVATCLRWYR